MLFTGYTKRFWFLIASCLRKQQLFFCSVCWLVCLLIVSSFVFTYKWKIACAVGESDQVFLIFFPCSVFSSHSMELSPFLLFHFIWLNHLFMLPRCRDSIAIISSSVAWRAIYSSRSIISIRRAVEGSVAGYRPEDARI